MLAEVGKQKLKGFEMKRNELKAYIADVREFHKEMEDNAGEFPTEKYHHIYITGSPYLVQKSINEAVFIYEIVYNAIVNGLNDKKIEAICDIAELLED